eukprot:CAMPEP_0197621078 /NCGR_PEP_ID=MMETSP1338-20131121/1719_1 /TAXON_ID=43686 ORGANISM="Pelagodinium beii, Strain RCC1491" /NCGR_SAMPLE_ID=MMETSP1338 /ASSEMBLY_ACC=CAM_ASM_000754 /LENGTH=62 /DNA_ID=CAMNT_0043190413 /DNA_START=67 /DNA_END=251 /DNA_ORIENTATION=+
MARTQVMPIALFFVASCLLARQLGTSFAGPVQSMRGSVARRAEGEASPSGDRMQLKVMSPEG